MRNKQKSWTCPRCKTTTYNLQYVRDRWCEPCDGDHRGRRRPKRPPLAPASGSKTAPEPAM